MGKVIHLKMLVLELHSIDAWPSLLFEHLLVIAQFGA
jgi:hypothetical protein